MQEQAIQKHEDEPKSAEQQVYKTRDIDQDNTLLPMLIGGLVAVVIGAIVVMVFV
ncbi:MULTISPECIES: hypothetical protein [unclassified Hoeflea]|jgi:uncharacterized protein (DUF2062 family)|uniref:hypothetical protein n=1 Tax=unclassified Hoeflea TaxID=2614931 RepID=UPI0039900394